VEPVQQYLHQAEPEVVEEQALVHGQVENLDHLDQQVERHQHLHLTAEVMAQQVI
jgi:hypothetical protein